jgi:hypothetical protein
MSGVEAGENREYRCSTAVSKSKVDTPQENRTLSPEGSNQKSDIRYFSRQKPVYDRDFLIVDALV